MGDNRDCFPSLFNLFGGGYRSLLLFSRYGYSSYTEVLRAFGGVRWCVHCNVCVVLSLLGKGFITCTWVLLQC